SHCGAQISGSDSSSRGRDGPGAPRRRSFSIPHCRAVVFCAIGVYGSMGPFWALTCEFLTGFSAAVGIALINSVGNLGGLLGPYMIGAIAMRTGNLYGGWALAGVFVFIS